VAPRGRKPTPQISTWQQRARPGWNISQPKRDAVYGYLAAVFEIVVGWKEQRRAKGSSFQALIVTKKHKAIGINEPFAVVIFCTSEAGKLDAKTRSKWSLRRAT